MARQKNKKKDALFTEESRKIIHSLGVMGYDVNHIKDLAIAYKKANTSRSTIIAPDTFLAKVSEISTFLLRERNKETLKGQAAHFSFNDVLNFIKQNIKLVNRDTTRELKEKVEMLDHFPWGSRQKSNEIVKENPFLFTTSNEKIWKITTILGQMETSHEGERINLAEYCLLYNQQQYMNSPQKIYHRLKFMQEIGTIQEGKMEKADFTKAMKAKNIFEKRFKQYQVTDEILEERYPLPEYDLENKQEFEQEIKRQFAPPVPREEHELE